MPLMYEVRRARNQELLLIAPFSTLSALLGLEKEFEEKTVQKRACEEWPLDWPLDWFPLSIRRLPLELPSPPVQTHGAEMRDLIDEDFDFDVDFDDSSKSSEYVEAVEHYESCKDCNAWDHGTLNLFLLRKGYIK